MTPRRPPAVTARSDMQTTKLRSKINENSTPVHRKKQTTYKRERGPLSDGRGADKTTLQTSD